MKTEKVLFSAQSTNTKLRMGERKLIGSSFKFMVVCQNELGEQIVLPFDPTKDLVIQFYPNGEKIEQITQHAGQLHINSNKDIQSVTCSQTSHITCKTIENVVCNQAILSNVEVINKCYAGCGGSHLNKEGKVRVRKSKRNPFAELIGDESDKKRVAKLLSTFEQHITK